MDGTSPSHDTPFSELADVCDELKSTAKRIEKRRIIAGFLKRLRPHEVSAATLLIIGRMFPESQRKALNVGWATLSKTLARGRQATLISHPLIILEVQETLLEVAASSGTDSAKAKRRLLDALLGRANVKEKEVILQNIFGEMRHGVNEGVMLDALAEAAGVELETIRVANMLSGDIGAVADRALSGGEKALRGLGLSLFSPIRPMLAENASSIAEALESQGGRTAAEQKLDGVRIQIHKRGGEVRVFSRRLSDVTESVPEVVSLAGEFKGDSILVEGEIVAVDQSGKPLPFQDLMRRFRRGHDIDAAMREIPLKLHLFDILYLDGKLLIDEPYERRWSILATVVAKELLVRRIVSDSIEDFELFLDKALKEGHEGLMLKRIDGLYTPGKRGKLWLKLKPADTLDMIVLAAEWGYGRREGWLSNYHLGVRAGDGYSMVGKTFKGLTDEEFKWMTKKLQGSMTSQERWGVKVDPKIVVEVEYNEIQKSPHYDSGFALRFARIKRIREDKGHSDVDTLERLKSLYEKQFERKGRFVEP